MKKITFLALHLNYGGIEKCLSDVCNLLCNDYEIEILSTYKLQDKPIYYFNDKIKITYLTNVKPNREKIKYKLKHFKIFSLIIESFISIKVLYLKRHTMIKALKNNNSDTIISTRDYFNKLLGKYSKCKYKIGWEHNHHNNSHKYINNFINSCKNLNKVILVSRELKDYYTNIFKEKNINCECVYIPNFVNNSNARTNLNNKNIISVGRLEKEKGFEDLIDVFNIIHDKDKEIKLNIVGTGSLYSILQKKIKDLHLQDNIKLLGFKNIDEINELYSNSSIYLMTSLTESFGLVLVEAMVVGVVPIAFDSARGALEIIENGKNGYLIKNRSKEEMANLVIDLLKDRDTLKTISNNALGIINKYNSDNSYRLWKDLLER